MSRRLHPAGLIFVFRSVLAFLPVAGLAGIPGKPRIAAAQELPGIAEKTASLERRDGFIPLYHDEKGGKLYLEITLPGKPFLYMSYLASGGLDVVLQRGQPDWATSEALVQFERHGPRVLLVRYNTDFTVREGGTAALRTILDQSVPRSVIGSFPIVAEEEEEEEKEGRVLLDATDYFLQDAHDVPQTLADYAREAGFRLVRDRSAIHATGTRAFPRNTEVESLLTFATAQPGAWARRYLPDSRTLAIRQRHSLVALPPDGFRPRAFDPRIGFGSARTTDYSASVVDGYRRWWISRWRLEKKDPSAPLSEPVEPITVYLEAAIPDEFRGAVRDGILYWNRVFRAAGFENAIRVEDLPADADPLDLRYPVVVFWAPTRNIAAGPSVVDARTREKIKGMIFLTGMNSRINLNTYLAIRPALAADQPDANEFLMARLRWAVAHEAGHVLAGLVHNTVVPTLSGFLMPRLDVGADGRVTIDLSDAGPGDPLPYDEWAVRYAYTPFESGEEEAAGLAAIVQDGLREGLRFVDDYGAKSIPRATGRLHGDDVLANLEREMAVRRVLLDHFGTGALRPGEPMSLLFERLIPVYFVHHYALAAVAKAVGGVDYRYALAGDGQTPVQVIDASEQREAIALLLELLTPEELAIPDSVARLIPPRAPALIPSEFELPEIEGRQFAYLTGESSPIFVPLSAGGVFDALDWARALSRMVVRELLDRTRAARVAALHTSGLSDLSVIEVMERVVDGTWGVPVPANPGQAELARIPRRAVLGGLLSLANDELAVGEVREAAGRALGRLHADLLRRDPADPAERAHIDQALRELNAFLQRGATQDR